MKLIHGSKPRLDFIILPARFAGHTFLTLRNPTGGVRTDIAGLFFRSFRGPRPTVCLVSNVLRSAKSRGCPCRPVCGCSPRILRGAATVSAPTRKRRRKPSFSVGSFSLNNGLFGRGLSVPLTCRKERANPKGVDDRKRFKQKTRVGANG